MKTQTPLAKYREEAVPNGAISSSKYWGTERGMWAPMACNLLESIYMAVWGQPNKHFPALS
jgi:hypothetical protein